MNAKALLLCLAAAWLVAGCGRNDPQDTHTDAAGESEAAPDGTATPDGSAPGTAATPPDGTTPVPADTAGAPPASNLSEAERGALGVLNAINEHEVAAGQQALEKQAPEKVAAFAQMMVDEHGKNRDQTNRFGPNADDAKAAAQRAKGKAELDTLGKLQGDAYAKAYVDAMVKGHTEALAALDKELIPAAADPAVRTHLADTRAAVAKHLESAKQLQSSGN